MTSDSSRTGFQGSETTSADVVVYSNANDVILRPEASQKTLRFRGKTERSTEPSVVSVRTNKKMGAPAGSITVTLKSEEDLTELIVDDDWIDVTLLRHGKPTHIMRGLVRGVELTEQVAGSGVTSETYTITADEWSILFAKTPVWYNVFAAENAGNALTLDVYGALGVAGDVEYTVARTLYGFLETLAGVGRSNWQMPSTMPGRNDDILNVIALNSEGYTNEPDRIAVGQQLNSVAGQSVWQMAQDWSDPMFCELWTDLGLADGEARTPFRNLDLELPAVGGSLIDPQRETTPEDTAMTVFLRDRPFPSNEYGSDSPWFKLPTIEVPHQHIVSKRIGRSGNERFNAFFVAPYVVQQFSGKTDLQAPLWDPEDIRRHGLRRFEVQSRYLTDTANLFTLARSQRRLVRDWHVLNPYFYNGTVTMGRLYPGLRIGMRLRIPGETDETDETYYVEEVSHMWQAGQGGKTTAGVTRGWRGTDAQLLQALTDKAFLDYRVGDGSPE